MAKTSTHFPITSFIVSDKKNVKEVSYDNYPSREVVKNILNYSNSLKIEKSHAVGLVEIVLN